MEDSLIITVSQLNAYLKSIVESAPALKTVYIKGEISNYVRYYKTGHIYMSVKDSFASVRVVIFNRFASQIKFEPENGMNVIVFGKITVYEKDGTCQIQGFDLQPDGIGAAYLQLQQLKKKLEEEGLFDESRKKPIPRFPKVIGVITSKSGAAVSDIKNTVANRYPIAKIILAPVMVQGETAAMEITQAVKRFTNENLADVLIVARGGGSTEDLSAFNDEQLIRAVYACKTPVISAVGHEIDTTLMDLVADARASTPTYGAMLATPDQQEILVLLMQMKKKMNVAAKNKLSASQNRLNMIKTKPCLTSAGFYLQKNKFLLNDYAKRLMAGIASETIKSEQRFTKISASLDAMSPLKVLGRGYSILFKDGKVVYDSSFLETGDSVSIRMKDADVKASVYEISPFNREED